MCQHDPRTTTVQANGAWQDDFICDPYATAMACLILGQRIPPAGQGCHRPEDGGSECRRAWDPMMQGVGPPDATHVFRSVTHPHLTLCAHLPAKTV